MSNNNTSIKLGGNTKGSKLESGEVIILGECEGTNDTSISSEGDVIDTTATTGAIKIESLSSQDIAFIKSIVMKSVRNDMTPKEAIDIIFVEMDNKPTTKKRVVNALKAGVTETLKAAFNHPVVHIPLEMLKAYSESK